VALQPVDHHRHLVAGVERHVADDLADDAFGQRRRSGQLSARSRLAVNADAELDLVSASVKVGEPLAGTVQEVSAKPRPRTLAATFSPRP
jgi:hypothetical protein